MSLIILFILLLIVISVCYKISENMLVSPIFIYSASFFLAVGICLCSPNWIFSPSLDTIGVILLGICSFGVGQIVLNRINIVSSFKIGVFSNREYQNKKAIIFCIMLQFICLILWANFFLSKSNGINMNSIKQVRAWMLYNDIPNYLGQAQLISKVIAMISFFDLVKKGLKNTYKFKKLYIFSIFLYILIEIISTSRSGIIYFCCYAVTLLVIFIYKNSNHKVVARRKTIKTIVIISSIVLIFFLLLGFLSRKTELLGITNMVSIYFGGSVYDLNYYMSIRNQFSSPSFGYFTIPLIKSIALHLGKNVVVLDKYYFPFVNIEQKYNVNYQTESNLYTCLVKPITDYGLLGMVAFFVILGILYALMFNKCKYQKNELIYIYYSYIMIPVYTSSSEYIYGTFLFSPLAMYTLIYIWLFYFIMHKNGRDIYDTI